MSKTKKEIIAVKESMYQKTHFCFDFLGLHNIYIENFFVNKLISWVQNGLFLKPFKILA